MYKPLKTFHSSELGDEIIDSSDIVLGQMRFIQFITG